MRLSRKFSTILAICVGMLGVFVVLSVSAAQPPLLEVVAELDTPAMDVTVEAGIAYVAGWSGGFLIYDVSVPHRPKLLASLSPSEVGGYIEDVQVLSGTAYLASGSVTGLTIVDVTDPSLPKVTGVYTTPGRTRAVSVADNVAYLADSEKGMRVIDISDPTQPTEIAHYPADIALDVLVDGQFAYLGYVGGLEILDISNLTSIRRVGWYTAVVIDPDRGARPSIVYEMEKRGDLVYLATGQTGFRIVDVSDPANPQEIGAHFTNLDEYYYDLAVQGPLTFLVSAQRGLIVLDTADPSAPQVVTTNKPSDSVWGVHVAGRHAYVTETAGRVHIYDFAIPVHALITEEGGTLSSPADGVEYQFDSGVFTQPVILTHTPLRQPSSANGWLVPIGHTYQVTAVYSGTNTPAQPTTGTHYTVTIRYSDAELGTVSEDSLALYYWGGQEWIREATTSVDPLRNVITATPGHFSEWAVLGETNRIFLPLAVKH